MRNINTYGELVDEIKRSKKFLEACRNRFGFEFGDDYDLCNHINHMKKVKLWNEQQWDLREKVGAGQCKRCKSLDLDVTAKHLRWENEYLYISICQKCGYISIKRHKDCWNDIPFPTDQDLMEIGEYERMRGF